jgi:two-component system, NtrC family, nitrogen regulation sensor histidine kinase NtrY
VGRKQRLHGYDNSVGIFLVESSNHGRGLTDAIRAGAGRWVSRLRLEPVDAQTGDGQPVPLDGSADRLPGASERAFWTGLVVVVLSLVSGLATYLILTGLTPIAPRNDVVVVVLFINIVLILAMFAVLGLQAAGLVGAWRRKAAGARIHVRIVGLFTIVAALPAILLAVAATVSFSRSLDTWFSSRTRIIVANSLDVARAYLDEHGQVVRADMINMTKDIDDLVAKSSALDASSELANLVMAQTGLRELSFAAIVDTKGQIVTQALGDTRVRYEPPLPETLAQVAVGEVVLMLSADNTSVTAVSKLERLSERYLYAARSLNPRVVGHLLRTEAAVAEYEGLRAARGGLKIVHGVMYFMIALTGVLAAIWVGLWFARHLVAPIRRLIGAAQRVAQGDLAVKLPLRRGEGDLRRLSRDFNYMTKQLSEQRNGLVTANAQLTERRRFMEAVLSGVSAGVIGLDAEDRVRLANPSAERLLGLEVSALVGRTLDDAVPELAAAIASDGEHDLKPHAQRQITLTVGGEERSFAVRVTREQAGGEDDGSVVTFDDITELVSAQRASAWGDVARRIAHEIKNPLTPIQLSAERIKRKYSAGIGADRDTFDKLTDTIVRQVGDIKKMVDEFASFARVPKPQMMPADVRETVQEPIILFREAHPAIAYDMRVPAEPLMISCDQRLLTQAITNLVKNATESVESAGEAADRPTGWSGRVDAVVEQRGDRVDIEIVDNGLGLPKHQRARLLEPYVTTKGNKGTGLGLAIVQKIVEQHGGRLTLEDAPPGEGRSQGALVRLSLPIRAGVPTRAANDDRAEASAQRRLTTTA